MALEVITVEDLHNFKHELVKELQQLFNRELPTKPKEWLRSSEVRKLLKISPGTLQNLRINGSLQFTKIGGIIYYRQQDLEDLLSNGMKAQ